MKSKIVKLVKFVVCLWAFSFPVSLSAQQVIADYNLLDSKGSTLIVEGVDNETLAYLNDKNDYTCFVVENFSGSVSIRYEAESQVVINGFLLLPADDEKCDPRTCRLYGSNDAESWTMLASVLGAEFPGRYESLLTTVANTESYKYIRLTISGINGGEHLKLAEYQLLGYEVGYNGIMNLEDGVLTGEYEGNTGEKLNNVINDNMSSRYKQNNAKTFWIEYEFNQPQSIAGYSITSTTVNNYTTNLRSWELYASENGDDWECLDVRSNKDLFRVANNQQLFEFGKESKDYDWGALADLAHQSMMEYFWAPYGAGYYMIHGWHPNSSLNNYGYNYWWMAHVLDVFVDAYARTNNTEYRLQMNRLYNGALRYSQNVYGRYDLWNGFYDDMEWMGLACLRASEVITTTPRWKEDAIQLWNWTKNGWNEEHHGGGIQWNDASPAAKNACSNAPAIILAARLYNATQEEEYLEWAIKIFDWMNNGLIREDGLVMDSFNDPDWIFTYNQGTWIGACLELYKITGDSKYYDIAMRTADYIVADRETFSPFGVLYNNEGGQGDGGLFKGILMRYLAQWILSGELDEERENYFVEYMYENGRSLWEAATLKPEIIFRDNWMERPKRMYATDETGDSYHASRHVSGVMLFELLDELKRNGYVPKYKYEQTETKEYKYYRLEARSRGYNIELAQWQLYSDFTNGIESAVVADMPVFCETIKGGIRITNRDMASLLCSIFNVEGALILKQEVKGESQEIYLTPGVYIVHVSDRKGTYKQKIVIR